MKAVINNKAFGDKTIFNNRVFHIPDGMTTAILGPSGRGKTTLLRILSGLDKDYDGCIEGSPEAPAILFQEDRLLERLTVLSNLMAVTNDRNKALEALKSIGLSGEEGHYIHELSGGMRRRVAISRLLLFPGDAVFLDEPFRGLDDESAAVCASVIKQYAEGKTLLFITHNEHDLELLSPDKTIAL